MPLNSRHPPQLAAGLRRTSPDQGWSAELGARWVAAKSSAEVDASHFAPPAYAVFDLFTTWRATRRLSLSAGLWNLTDDTYWEWADARGQTADSPTLDRFTAPGRNLSFRLRYRN